MGMDNFQHFFDYICTIKPVHLKSTIIPSSRDENESPQPPSININITDSTTNEVTPLMPHQHRRPTNENINPPPIRCKGPCYRMKIVGIFLLGSVLIAIIISFGAYFIISNSR